MEDVEKCTDSLKCHKAPYLDNICSEHLIHAGPHLIVHLSLLFNSMIHHCMVPSDFCNGFILPLLKNKHGDATDVLLYFNFNTETGLYICTVVLLFHL